MNNFYIDKPLIEKYRPDKLNDIISQNTNIYILKKFIRYNNFPHLLMYGPPGVGKTSTIISCANELFKNDMCIMTLELNASDDRGIETVRTSIKQFVSTKYIFNNDNMKKICKLVILDEVDSMTNDAQFSLKRIIEKYTNNARFCIICNYLQKINSSLKSHCICLNFILPDSGIIFGKLKFISDKEMIRISDNAIRKIIYRSRGDIRKMINMLHSLSFYKISIHSVDVDSHFNYLNNDQLSFLFMSLFNSSFYDTYCYLYNIIFVHNISLLNIIYDIFKMIVNYIIYSKIINHNSDIQNHSSNSDNNDTDNTNGGQLLLSDSSDNTSYIYNNFFDPSTLNKNIINILEKLNSDNIIYLLNNIKNMEININMTNYDNIQICAFIGIFKYILK